MGKLIIQRHDFEKAKKEIKKFSEESVTNLDLERVKESKDLGEYLEDILCLRGIGLDHVVKGAELNALTLNIQKKLQSINNTQIRTINKFGQVYNALEALDKDYIQGILVSIKENEEASEAIKWHQEQIDKIVADQRKYLTVLKRNQEQINKIVADQQKYLVIEIEKQKSGIVNSIESLTKKIKNAYLLAGGAAVLAIIEMLLLLR